MILKLFILLVSVYCIIAQPCNFVDDFGTTHDLRPMKLPRYAYLTFNSFFNHHTYLYSGANYNITSQQTLYMVNVCDNLYVPQCSPTPACVVYSSSSSNFLGQLPPNITFRGIDKFNFF